MVHNPHERFAAERAETDLYQSRPSEMNRNRDGFAGAHVVTHILVDNPCEATLIDQVEFR